MQVFIIPGVRDWHVIVKGPLPDANLALGRAGIHPPFRHMAVNGYGSIHATVSATEDQLIRWMKAEYGLVPGALLFYCG